MMTTKVIKLIDILRSFGLRKSFALNDLDIKLRPYIGFRNGFFVEVGAYDGITQSNTYYFEKFMGWKGLLIEAVPSLADLCRQNRPRCIVENCALVASDYPEATIQIRYCGLMSTVKGAFGSPVLENAHIDKGKRFLSNGDDVSIIEVPARTLSWVLDNYNIKQIDLLSLDVEGFEAQVLRGLDFNRHCPNFMLIEVRKRIEIESIIGQRYEPIAILNIDKSYSDILYKRKNSPL